MPDTPHSDAGRRRGKAVRQRTRLHFAAPGSYSLRARLRYRFDTSLARGPIALVAWLAGLVLLVAVAGAIFINVISATFGGSLNSTLKEDLWQSILRTVDTGTFSSDTEWPTRLVALTITLSGIFLAGSLIGIIASAIDQRVERLRLGRSPVLEVGHTLILGWSPRLPLIIRELVVANQNLRHSTIVVLSALPKTEMEEQLRDRIGDTGTTRVICRTGHTSAPDYLEIVNLTSA